MVAMAFFNEDFKSVKFVMQETGEEIDMRAVLTNIAYGRVGVNFDFKYHENGSIEFETWTLEATDTVVFREGGANGPESN